MQEWGQEELNNDQDTNDEEGKQDNPYDGTMHTVLWTDSFSNVPAGISSMAQTIENMASDEYQHTR
jgi:hypothetical protein